MTELADDIDTYATDYCNNIETTVASKIAIIKSISDLDPDSDDFTTDCETIVDTAADVWYDPFIASDSISSSDMCSAL